MHTASSARHTTLRTISAPQLSPRCTRRQTGVENTSAGSIHSSGGTMLTSAASDCESATCVKLNIRASAQRICAKSVRLNITQPMHTMIMHSSQRSAFGRRSRYLPSQSFSISSSTP